jgi:hypothetical protein
MVILPLFFKLCDFAPAFSNWRGPLPLFCEEQITVSNLVWKDKTTPIWAAGGRISCAWPAFGPWRSRLSCIRVTGGGRAPRPAPPSAVVEPAQIRLLPPGSTHRHPRLSRVRGWWRKS